MATDVGEVLKHLHTLFRSCLNFQSISPHLRSHRLLTNHEWEIISKKDGREDQVDEFLKCLPHKGKDCLERLLECLQLSLDHSGHQDLISELSKHIISDVAQSEANNLKTQDEFEKAVSTINNLYSNQKATVAMLLVKLNQQEAKMKQLELNCNNQVTTIQQLSDTISNQKADIISLESKLQDKEKLLNTWSDSIVNGHSYENGSYEGYKMSSSSFSSQDSVASNDNFECGPPPANDGSECSDAAQQRLSPNMHSTLTTNLSIEDKMKIYHTNLASFRRKCHQLEEEKTKLKESKHQLELEVVRLREELDGVSFRSSISSINVHRCKEMPVVLSDDMYLNPLHQGWLTKEGGHKKSWKRRWCMLSSRFFFYFEDKNVELKSQKPIGILPLTKDMEVTDCKRENTFEVHEKSRVNMKSCKLDKTSGAYIPGNHAVYNLQASSDGDRRQWIKAFQTVFESLKLSN